MYVCCATVRASSSVEGMRSAAIDQGCAVSSAYLFTLNLFIFVLGSYFLIVRSEDWLYNYLCTVWAGGSLSMSRSYRACLPVT